jgi:hypothetical protein
MKSLITLVVLGMFSAAMVGCEANAGARVGDPDNKNDTTYKKTTTVDNNGDRTVKTQTTVEKN